MINKIKIKKMQSLIARNLTIIIQREINNEIINTLSINAVKLSNNLIYAKIFYSSLLNKSELEFNNIIKKFKNKIRNKLSHKLKIYRCPNLKFIFDYSLYNANNIQIILKNLKLKK